MREYLETRGMFFFADQEWSGRGLCVSYWLYLPNPKGLAKVFRSALCCEELPTSDDIRT